jgi:hypothetical protein
MHSVTVEMLEASKALLNNTSCMTATSTSSSNSRRVEPMLSRKAPALDSEKCSHTNPEDGLPSGWASHSRAASQPISLGACPEEKR